MENKLSELSKPVAYDYQYAGVETCEGFGSWRNELTWDCPPDWMVETGKVKNLKPRYSQEYVSALLAELEAKDERITTVTEEREFWRERVEGAEKEREEFRRRFNLERTYTEDADKRIAELEAKLATPVRFPDCDTAAVSIMAYWLSDEEVNAWVKGIEFAKQQVRAAGFTVGDE